MSKEFTRGARYVVLKNADIMQCLTVNELIQLRYIQARVGEHRAKLGKPLLDCVVVESDWPEYEPTWNAIEMRMTGSLKESAVQTATRIMNIELIRERDDLRAKIEQSGPDGFAWPECPKRRQSHVLFDDGYEEGWAACVATIKAAWKSEGQIMCTINDEEPAFPVSTSNPYSGHQAGPNTWQFPGMTLRDYFAAKAMQGLFAAGGGVTRGAGEWASIAYKMADAMLATRNEK